MHPYSITLVPTVVCLTIVHSLAYQVPEFQHDLQKGDFVAPVEDYDVKLFTPDVDGKIDDAIDSHDAQTVALLQKRHMPACISLPVVVVAALICFFVGGIIGPKVPKALAGYLVCLIYVIFSVAIDLSIAVQKGKAEGQHNHHSYNFNPTCSVLVTEAVKFGISMLLYSLEKWRSHQTIIPWDLTFTDVKWLMVPAVVFTINNILVFQAIGKNDMSTFGVFRDTMILWTALLWRGVFRTPLGYFRLGGILIIFIGLVLNQFSTTGKSGAWSWAFLWVLLMTWCNAFGSVINEYALKLSKSLDINIQNMVLYAGCIFCSFFYILVTDKKRIELGPSMFFQGFDNKTWFTVGLQSVTGLLVSRMLKHADAIMKTVATCLRGPIIVFLAPIFTKSKIGALIAISACIVASGCITYLTQGPLKSQKEMNEEAAKKKEREAGIKLP